MEKIWLLTKVQLGSALDLNLIPKSKNNKKLKKRKPVLIVATVFIILLIAAASFLYSYGVGTTLQMIGMLELLPELMMAITCMITIVTTIYKVKGTLFGFKDFDVIMSLPVKTSYIATSRMLLLYLINITFTLIIMLPANLAYGILAQAEVSFYAISLLTVLFIPLLPMVIAAVIGTLIAIVAARFRHSNVINLIITFALFAGFMLFSFTIGDSEEKLGELSAAMTKQVDGLYPLARMYRIAVCEYNFFSIILFILISITSFILFAWIVGLRFKAINTFMASNHTKANYKMGNLEQTSPFIALYQKEIKRYFSSTLYVMNTAFGIVMMTMGAIATLFISPETLAQVMEVPQISQYIGALAPIFVSMCVAMTFVTACSISLEGKNLWILKAAPVSSQTIFNSKIAVNLTVTIPAVVVDAILITIGLKLSLGAFILLLVMPTVYAFFIAIVGLIVNLKLPKLNWTTEVIVIKQSAATLVTTFIGLFIVMVPTVLFFILHNVNSLLLNGLITLIVAAITICMYQYLNTKGAKLLSSL